jgi:hypothetical protein
LTDKNEQQWVISFGRGVRLMSEEYYIRELRPFGITGARSFRSLCRAICCPVILMGRVGFVDPAVFQVCIKHLSMPGSKDFKAPNSIMQTSKKRPYLRSRVEPREVRRNWKMVVRAIIDARRMHGLQTPPADRAAIRSAAAELTRFVLTMIPSGEQEQANGTQATRSE